MATFKEVPIVDVNTGNFDAIYPSMVVGINNSYFISLDLELSGIGKRREINCSSIEDRYNALSEVAKTRAVISLGISCFKLQPKESQEENNQCVRFLVQTYNILLLCNENYIVEPATLQFLIDHGFDFNRQYSSGLPYYRGIDKDEKASTHYSIRQLFNEILKSKVPVVLHNGFVDLIFLYENLYCNLPSSLSSFIVDLSELFPSGIYDTKYVCEYHARMPASYLQYIFRKKQRENADKMLNGKSCIGIDFLSYSGCSGNIEYHGCEMRTNFLNGSDISNICQNYAVHGWCSKGRRCPNSHDIDDVLDREKAAASKKKKRRKISDSIDDANGELDNQMIMDSDPTNNAVLTNNSCQDSIQNDIQIRKCSHGHRAGFDAFMTGFVFAAFLSTYFKDSFPSKMPVKTVPSVEKLINKVFLTGKDAPLLVTRGNFGKPSALHRKKMDKLQL